MHLKQDFCRILWSCMQAIPPVRLSSASFQPLVEAVEAPTSSSPCSATHMHRAYALSSLGDADAALVANEPIHSYRHAYRDYIMSELIGAEVFDAHHLVLLFARWTLAGKSGLAALALSHLLLSVFSCAFLFVLRSNSSLRQVHLLRSLMAFGGHTAAICAFNTPVSATFTDCSVQYAGISPCQRAWKARRTEHHASTCSHMPPVANANH